MTTNQTFSGCDEGHSSFHGAVINPQLELTKLWMRLDTRERLAFLIDVKAAHPQLWERASLDGAMRSPARIAKLASRRAWRWLCVAINAATACLESILTRATFAVTTFRAPIVDALENTKEDSK